jgi:hypothetical protein
MDIEIVSIASRAAFEIFQEFLVPGWLWRRIRLR